MADRKNQRATPHGWEPIVGVAGTDFTVDPTQSETGNTSIKMLSTAVATEFQQAWIPLEGHRTGIGPEYYIEAMIRASSIAGGNTVTVEATTYLQDKVTSVGTLSIHNAVLVAANTWELKSKILASANAYWVRLRIVKAANAFNVWFDRVNTRRLPRSLRARRITSDLSMATGATAVLNTASQAGITWDTSTGIGTIQVAGYYAMHVQFSLESMADATHMEPRLFVNGSVDRVLARTYNGSGGADLLIAAASTMRLFADGNTFHFTIVHDHGSARNLRSDDPNTEEASRLDMHEIAM